ncbi:unnamed protein product [Rotaria magnacalcarata]|uniref:E3 ubiquitin-protein ligase n=9 Tax=Rotaria magnacalcarata TaxID=392030 RepID=A0A816HDG1_9BILA|nr:unnamed protein product [Rotaria magnacalcarata]CAF1684319.1 unnamed protein product [Rotaria magnacalcarata]
MEADPEELLVWLKGDGGGERDLQISALEQLCMLVLMCDNIDRCFEQYQPRLFLPALCDIFSDPLAPTRVLEVTARALTYFLDVSVDCAKKITQHASVIRSMCACLQVVDIEDRTNKDLAEQIIKVFERLSSREASSIYEQDGLRCVLDFINNWYSVIHKDSLQSALNVVVKLIGKIDPQNSPTLDQTIESLSNLLLHVDTFVSDNALRCFATLADRFARKNVDPEPLMRYCLKDVLLRSLHYVSKSTGNTLTPVSSLSSSTNTETTGSHNVPLSGSNTRGVTTNLSVVTGLLSTLCRGSAKVTHDLLRSDLPDALESALCGGDERCVLDTMRFLDLLIVLLFDGRQVLPRPVGTARASITAITTTNVSVPITNATIDTNRHASSSSSLSLLSAMAAGAGAAAAASINSGITPSDRSQQQIIEFIRSRDVQGFINHIEQGSIDVNYTDNVGQTMLNWVAAFGTREMIEYLCRRGADVNRGQRSSSLHYAACFGRPSIVRLLLKYGGNVDLRDEDGRTALDKARERQDEGHQEVVEILQSAHEWTDIRRQEPTPTTSTNSSIKSTEQTITTNEIKGDIEMQPIYLQRLLSIFCQLYQNTMILTIKRNTLRLVSKLLHYATVEQIRVYLMQGETNILTTLFELLSSILDTNEDDDDTSNLVLLIIKNLFEKDRYLFLEQFQYLGLIWKITSLALSHPVTPSSTITNITADQQSQQPHSSLSINILAVDAKEILCHRPYVWNEFNILRNRECLYLWSISIAIELSMGSNGWFRFFADNSLSTMYSSGSPETNVDTSENRHDFIDKLQRLKQQVLDGIEHGKNDENIKAIDVEQQLMIARTLFTSDTSNERTITVGHWTFECNGPTQLRIHNVEGEQVTIIEQGQPGFIFESNRGTRHTYHAQSTLGNEFSIPWSTIESLNSSASTNANDSSSNSSVAKTSSIPIGKTKQEQMKHRTTELALLIYNDYLKNVTPTNYTRSVLNELKAIVNDLNNDLSLNSFEKLKNFLVEKTSLSLYELSSSGLVSSLLKIFHGLLDQSSDEINLANERSKLFSLIFLSNEQPQAFYILIRKLVSILESIEKLPLFLYDTPSSYGLQIFSKRFRFQLHYQNRQQLFTDRTGKSLKIEPLATVGQLKAFLASMVSKQWYDHPHTHLEFIKHLKTDGRQQFTYVSDFDHNGILYWIGTNARTISNYTNPNSTGLISVTCSDNNCAPQQLSEMISHPVQADDDENTNDTYHGCTWVMLDLGLWVIPTHFTLRHSTGGFPHWTRSFLFQISKDGAHFIPCDISLVNDTNSSVATWNIKNNLNENSTGFRYIRIHQKSGRHPVSMAGFELYGQVISAIDIRSKSESTRSRSNRDDNRNRSTSSRQVPHYHHSTSSASNRANKMQSHILRRLASMRTSGTAATSSTGNSNGSNTNASNNRSAASTIDRILFDQMIDLSSIPIDLSTALESDDPERLRMVIQETLSRLTGDTILNDNTNLLNIISQRKSVSTPNISNGEPIFSVSSTEQASSVESLISSSRTTEHAIDLMQGFRDQIARQYDALVAQTQLEPTIEEPTSSLWLSSSTEDFLTPIRSNTSNAGNWLELGEYNEETLLTSKDEPKDKHDNTPSNASNENNTCDTRLFTSAQTTPITTTTHSRQSISSTTESVESMCAVTEENNKKNATSECSEQRIILLENDMNASVPNLSTTNPNNMTLSNLLTSAQSSPNLTITAATTLNIVKGAIIDDESMPMEESQSLSEIPLSDQQQKQNDETSEDEDMEDDEHCHLKRAKLNSQQIQPPMDTNEEDEDDDEDEADEEEAEQDEHCGLFDEQEEEEYDEQLQEQLHGEQQSLTRRNWDDDFVLKRQFSVLLPAFDGRPGRTNINATQDIPVPTTMTPKQLTSSKQISTTDTVAAANMTLYIRGPSPELPGLKEIDIEMDDSDATIFKYIQQLIQPFPSSQRSERIKRIFEPTYTIVYTEKSNEQSKSDACQSFLSCPINLDMISIINENIQKSSSTNLTSNDPKDVCTIEDILELLRQLFYLSNTYVQNNPHPYHADENLSLENYFYSKKLNNKLLQQIQDSIIIASSSLPIWTEWLTHSYTFLYPFETRQLYFRTTSFGTSRSIVWLQERRDELIRAARTGGLLRPLGGSTTAATTTLSSFRAASNSNENSSSTSNVFVPEFRLGRLKIDRATPIDREHILRDAMNLFHYHAQSKAKLEIQFLNEEGTGDGPTLEFYALIATDLQKHSLGIWWHHDDHEHNQTIYVRKLEGLFPVPYSQNDERLDTVCNYFSLMGIYFAKCLLDKYLIDMPLSIAFLKLLCMKSKYNNDSNIWYDGILDLTDLIDIEPSRGKFFQQLYELIDRRNKIIDDVSKTNEEKKRLCSQLKVDNDHHESVDLEHLCLTFVYSPPSNIYGYQSIDLISNGSHIDVTIDNVDLYVKLSLEFIFRDGIRRQMNAFRNGFNQVFSIEHLKCFNSHELKLLLCGNQCPSWTLEDLLNYIEPSHGFTRDSPGFTKFLNVMLELDGLERKSVVQFITGCSSLPPGGLANLRPRLAVARKVEADDNSYPSVNTCYHYLKLPDYSSQEILKIRLMTACKERGFYFN